VPLVSHTSFNRPSVSTKLWRYIDLAKFVELLTSKRLWLTNAEVLAQDDPYEGLPSPLQFPHRLWKTMGEVPSPLREQIVQFGGNKTTEEAFKRWFMLREQEWHMMRSTRRSYYVNCWHAGQPESAAMWKIYGSSSGGIAIVSNGGRIDAALSAETKTVHLGAIQYQDAYTFQTGYRNGFDTLMIKRDSYAYEDEVRLVHWDTSALHDSLSNAVWNEEQMRFDGIIDDNRPIVPGINLECDVNVLIERVVVSPFSPPWYLPMIQRLCDQLQFTFPITSSALLTAPSIVP
jgi:hypothetical protein